MKKKKSKQARKRSKRGASKGKRKSRASSTTRKRGKSSKRAKSKKPDNLQPENDNQAARDLTKLYDLEPRWSVSKRCAVWLSHIPKRSLWSTGTTQSKKSDESLQSDAHESNDVPGDKPDATLFQTNKNCLQDTDKLYEQNIFKKKFNTATAEHKQAQDFANNIRSPYVSAKQLSESARETCYKNHQISKEAYMKNLQNKQALQNIDDNIGVLDYEKSDFHDYSDTSQNLTSRIASKYAETLKDYPVKRRKNQENRQRCLKHHQMFAENSFPRKHIQKYVQPKKYLGNNRMTNHNGKKPGKHTHGTKSKYNNLAAKSSCPRMQHQSTCQADTNAIGWMILKTIYELKGAKSFPVYIFHLLRKKGFCQLTISSLTSSLNWLQKKGLIISRKDQEKHYPRYIITHKGQMILEKRMQESMDVRPSQQALHRWLLSRPPTHKPPTYKQAKMIRRCR